MLSLGYYEINHQKSFTNLEAEYYYMNSQWTNTNWDLYSLHTLKLWIENNRYASSQENLLHIVCKGTNTHN